MRGTALFVLIVTLAIILVIPFSLRLNVEWLGGLLEELGNNPVPSVTGGYSFTGGFVEGVKATGYIASLPVRWSWFVLEQISIFFGYVGGAIF